MKLAYQSLLLVILLTSLGGCATIVSKSNWPFSVDSHPDNATVVITNKKGREVYRGITPAATKLKSGSGFFGKESYTVTLSMNGYKTRTVNLECKLNGWYFGNVLIGGLIGMLIVDPATGAMYKLAQDGISEKLSPDNKTTQLNILDLKDVPDSLRTTLVKLQ